MIKQKVFVAGYFGWGNIGDELLLMGIDKYLRQQGIAPDIRACCQWVAYSPLIPNVQYIKAVNPMALIQAISSSELVVFGGGTLFHDQTLRSVPFWSGIVLASKSLRKKVILVSQGFSIQNSLLKGITSVALNQADHVSVRDILDQEFLLNDLHLSKKVQLVPDLAFSLQSSFNYGSKDLFLKRKTIGVNLRHPSWWHSEVDTEKYVDSWATHLDKIIESLGVKIVMVPFLLGSASNSDFSLMSTVKKRMKNQDSVQIFVPKMDNTLVSSLADIFETFGLLIGSAYHSLIVSSMAGVPFLTVPYQTKSVNFTKMMGFSESILTMGFDTHAISDAWSNRSNLRERLLKSTAMLNDTCNSAIGVTAL